METKIFRWKRSKLEFSRIMFGEIEILTEEESMMYFLKGLLPRILPEHFQYKENYFIRPHNGKSDLIRSLPYKIRAYNSYPRPIRIVIIHDQDSNDCQKLKKVISDVLVRENNQLPYLIRIACREL